MKMIRISYQVVLAIVVCGVMLMPAVSSADRYEVLRELELHRGIFEETIPIGDSIQTRSTPRLKGVSISVQNGTENDKHRVASAQVFLNDEEIFKQNDFNHKYTSLSEFRDFPDGLSRIDIRVKVNGSKHSRLMVRLIGVYEDDPIAPSPVKYYLDRDGDGVGGTIFRISTSPPQPPPPPAAWVLITGDINDYNPDIQ
jgi:hypothetical protein